MVRAGAHKQGKNTCARTWGSKREGGLFSGEYGNCRDKECTVCLYVHVDKQQIHEIYLQFVSHVCLHCCRLR